MKKSVFFFSLIVTIFCLFKVSPVFSQDNYTDSVKTRLQQIEANQATTSATKKTSLTITFFEGQVTSTSNSGLVVDTTVGSKIVYTTDSTKFFHLESGSKKLIGFGDLKIGDNILIVGFPISETSGNATIIVRDLNKKIKNFSLLGKISLLANDNFSLTNLGLADLPTLKINFSPATNIVDSKAKAITLPTLGVDDIVVSTGTIDDKGVLNSLSIMRLTSNQGSTSTSSAPIK